MCVYTLVFVCVSVYAFVFYHILYASVTMAEAALAEAALARCVLTDIFYDLSKNLTMSAFYRTFNHYLKWNTIRCFLHLSMHCNSLIIDVGDRWFVHWYCRFKFDFSWKFVIFFHKCILCQRCSMTISTAENRETLIYYRTNGSINKWNIKLELAH